MVEQEIQAVERAIDKLVCGLTEEEIRIVEG